MKAGVISLAAYAIAMLCGVPYSVHAQACLVQEDFSNPSPSQWVPGSTGTVSFVNGTLHLEIQGIPSDVVHVTSWDCQYLDFRISVDLRDLDGTRKKDVAFRSRGSDLYGYHVDLGSEPANRVLLVKGYFGEDYPTILAEAPVVHHTAEWQHLVITVTGPTIRVEVNGTQLIQYTDPEPPQFGDIFLGVNAGGLGIGIAEFDNLLIEAYQAVPGTATSWGTVKSLYGSSRD
jgi:hypothetical protein